MKHGMNLRGGGRLGGGTRGRVEGADLAVLEGGCNGGAGDIHRQHHGDPTAVTNLTTFNMPHMLPPLPRPASTYYSIALVHPVAFVCLDPHSPPPPSFRPPCPPAPPGGPDLEQAAPPRQGQGGGEAQPAQVRTGGRGGATGREGQEHAWAVCSGMEAWARRGGGEVAIGSNSRCVVCLCVW